MRSEETFVVMMVCNLLAVRDLQQCQLSRKPKAGLQQNFESCRYAAEEILFVLLRCRQDVLFARLDCRNGDSETSERRGIRPDFIASEGPDRLDLRALGVYGALSCTSPCPVVVCRRRGNGCTRAHSISRPRVVLDPERIRFTIRERVIQRGSKNRRMNSETLIRHGAGRLKRLAE